MTDKPFLIATAEDFVGRELAVSDWMPLDQARVNMFAEATRHTHWMHTDPERAARESPYGGSLAHGFLMLSLISHFIDACDLRPADSAYALNYGVDKVRFLAPVVVGDGVRVRDRIKLLSAEPRKDGLLARTAHEIEVDGLDRPAVYAEYLALWVPKQAAA